MQPDGPSASAGGDELRELFTGLDFWKLLELKMLVRRRCLTADLLVFALPI